MKNREIRTLKNKLKLGLLLVCVVLLSLSGCAKVMPTPEPVTLRFFHAPGDTAYYETLAQEFHEQYPHITVELSAGNERRMGSRLVANEVDVFVTSQFALSFLRERNLIMNLSPFIEQDETFNPGDFYPGTLDMLASQGRNWGIPAGLDLMVLYYNQDLFDEYNVPYPEIGWTWEDFLDRAIRTSDPNANVYGYAPLYSGQYELYDVITFMYQHGGGLFDDLQAPTRTTFDDPLNIEALQWYQNLLYTHQVAPTPEEESMYRDYPTSGIAEGKFAMWNGLFSERGGNDNAWLWDWGLHWGMVPLPRDQKGMSLALINGYFIATNSPHPDESWQWIAFLSQKLPSQSMPTRKSLAESDAYETQVGAQPAAVARAAVQEAALVNPQVFEFDEEINILGEAVYGALNKSLSPEEALNLAQEEAKKHQ